jgi:hypothetical protein
MWFVHCRLLLKGQIDRRVSTTSHVPALPRAQTTHCSTTGGQNADTGGEPLTAIGPWFATYSAVVRVLVLVIVIGVSVGCGVDTSTQERPQEPPSEVHATPGNPATIAVPENPADRAIRRDLSRAIAQDAELNQRDISFIVTNGDVNVTGTVKSEEERRKINELAMNIGGVMSVANGLRVAE